MWGQSSQYRAQNFFDAVWTSIFHTDAFEPDTQFSIDPHPDLLFPKIQNVILLPPYGATVSRITSNVVRLQLPLEGDIERERGACVHNASLQFDFLSSLYNLFYSPGLWRIPST